MRKNKEIKIASAKDIYDYLHECADSNGIAHASKKDVARHFGYKSSNGDGFLSNFKFLEDSNLIVDVSENKRNGLWKVNSAENFAFPAKCESIRNKNKLKSVESVLLSNGVKLSLLEPIDSYGRMYIPLINISQAFNIDKHSIYNAGSSNNKIVSAYMQMISTDSKSQPKKSIEIEGLPYLFERLKKKVKPEVLESALIYVKSIYTSENASVDTEIVDISDDNPQGTVVPFPMQEAVVTEDNTSDEFVNAEQIDIDSQIQNDSEAEAKLDSDSIESDDDLNEILHVLDGIISIISEHKDLKTEIAVLKKENEELKSQNADLLEEASHKGADPEELAALQAKIADLKDKLAIANKANSEIMARTNLIRSYVKENSLMGQVVNK